MVKRGDMMDKQDIVEILAIDLIGMVPDDESILNNVERANVHLIKSME